MAKIPTTNYEANVVADYEREAQMKLKEQKSGSVSKPKTEEKKSLYDEVSDLYKAGMLDPQAEAFYLNSKDIFIWNDNVRMNESHTEVLAKKNFNVACNFAFFVKAVIRIDEKNTWFIVQVGVDKPFYMVLTNKEFSSESGFSEVLSTKQLTFLSGNSAFKQIRNSMPKVSESEYVATLGWNNQAEAYFFCNCAVKNGKVYTPNEFGLVDLQQEDKKTWYFDGVSTLLGEKQSDPNVDRFCYGESDFTFNKWFQLFYDAHLSHAILPACYLIASIFRDIVFHELNFFPLLYLRGAGGSGKSSIARNMTAIFGKPQKELSFKSVSTPTAMARRTGQLSNSVIWFDEWYPEMNPKIKESLQSMYDGQAYERATFDNTNRTKGTDVLSGIVITSNFYPMDNEPFFQRLILHTIDDATKTKEQTKAFKEIESLSKANLSQVCFELLQHRELIAKEFKDTHEIIYNYLYDHLPGCKTRYIDNMAGILAPAFILLNHKKIFMVQLDFLDELCKIARENIKAQLDIWEQDNSSVDFWNSIQILFNQGVVKKGFDMKLLNKEEGAVVTYDEYLAIRPKLLYQHYARMQGNRAKSEQEIVQSLMQADYFIEKGTSRFAKDGDDLGKTTNTTCLLLNYQLLKKQIGVVFE